MPARQPTLAETALRLRNADTEGWEQFMRAFAEYNLTALKRVINAPPDSILVLQGQAQQCEALWRLFIECDREKQPTP